MQFNYLDPYYTGPEAEGFGSAVESTGSTTRRRLYEAVAQLIQAPSDGKWFLVKSGDVYVVYFPLGDQCVLQNEWVTGRRSFKASYYGDPLIAAKGNILSQILHSDHIWAELAFLTRHLLQTTILNENVIYEYDPIHGGTNFQESPTENHYKYKHLLYF